MSLGIILNSGKAVGKPLRIPGVLQRIGLTYFIISVIELTFGKPQRSQMVRIYFIIFVLFDWVESMNSTP